MSDTLYIGLISGTSVDGIDAALIGVADDGTVTLRGGTTTPFATPLATTIKQLIANGAADFNTLGDTDVAIAQACADASLALLAEHGLQAGDIRAIGSHGQTVWHGADRPLPFTLQLGDPNVLATATGIPVVADFRRRDVALGGQGAPLVPPFHAALFGRTAEARVVVNLGGIANLTILGPNAAQLLDADAPPSGHGLRGFDSGPANALLDAWYARHRDGNYDPRGDWARSGTVCEPLLERLLGDEYFAAPPPKSTGKERFSLRWLQHHVAATAEHESHVDVQATLAELSARTVADAVHTHAPDADHVLLCGGGVENRYLCERLAALLAPATVASTASEGVDPNLIEAAAFAWLAHRRVNGLNGAFASVTGARQDSVCGGLY